MQAGLKGAAVGYTGMGVGRRTSGSQTVGNQRRVVVETAWNHHHVTVTFHLPFRNGATRASVVGEFNDWSSDANPMEPDGEGFRARVRIAPGRSYRFRYLLDGVRWENDWAADAYVPNEFGGEDSVVDLTSADGRAN